MVNTDKEKVDNAQLYVIGFISGFGYVWTFH
jgi:hypothetical protein